MSSKVLVIIDKEIGTELQAKSTFITITDIKIHKEMIPTDSGACHDLETEKKKRHCFFMITLSYVLDNYLQGTS